jgi:outer membrane murein-binding lipoprotein Lpp
MTLRILILTPFLLAPGCEDPGQAARIAELETRVEELETENDELKAALGEIREEVEYSKKTVIEIRQMLTDR